MLTSPCPPAPQRCHSVPDFASAQADEELDALMLRDDCAPLCSPRPSSSRSSQAEQLAALSAQMGSSSLCSPRTHARGSPDSVAAPGSR